MKKIFKTFIKKINNLFRISQIIENQNILKIASGKQLSNYNKTNQLDNINDYEFRVFSQFGEDGIIQHLINKLDIEEKKFLEFGVESYDEANTRFLLENDDWEGLIIEGKKKDVNYIKNQPYYLKKRFNAVNHFVNKNNINKIIGDNNFVGKIGLLSIDIDGNDYWIWEAINIIDPSIVICEFNARFGYEKAVTIPYDEFFSRTDAHESSIYYELH